ncbi:hypothetical protein V5O48_007018 [Marasmius crinis-equi]|uniref:Peptidase S9 prolyl oligopeptidase catalytic domain-containing protein n=1 Tax=Marasmius crinis-equi TaxID=585013 RepID=A0ABR3FHW7_9AGAR
MSPVTLTYKVVKDVPIKLDVYLPENRQNGVRLPAVVYFHGGGLVLGSRHCEDLFPTWLQGELCTSPSSTELLLCSILFSARTNAAGYAFISADYRLIPTGPTTGHDVVEDIKDVFAFLRGQDLKIAHENGDEVLLDPGKIAVSGSSAGGLCAYLSVIHVTPKPAAALPIFAMGGDFLTGYFTPRTEPFLGGRELVDASRFTNYIHPLSSKVASDLISESQLAFVPNSNPPIPANPRMGLTFLYFQLGTYLDYYTGQHEPSLSAALRDASKDGLQGTIPERHRALFPQLNVDSSWPPTYLLHGEEDTAVSVDESKNMHRLLKDAGVNATLKLVPGQDHYFDIGPNTEELYSQIYDEVVEFLKNHLC